jgi:hypothetical protein
LETLGCCDDDCNTAGCGAGTAVAVAGVVFFPLSLLYKELIFFYYI